MTIQSDDIKLLKSAVMADVPEGGGAATGIVIVDGQSNSLFPDTSTDDRAAGRVNLRKVFGMAHSDNADTLMGASFAVLKPPADPLVNVTLFETDGWADERTTAQEAIERYVVKGPRYSCRILDTHYTGSLLLQLYQAGGKDFPSPGEAVALRNPNGSEQYVRITKVTITSGSFNVLEGTTVTTFDANLAVCTLAQPLNMDVLGPPIARVTNEANFAQIYKTTLSSGAAFYGIKPLASPATVGQRAVSVSGGIYTPLVPAATVEEPLTDIAPLTLRSALCRTAQTGITLPAQSVAIGPGEVLRLPTAVVPGTLTITRTGLTLTDDGDGGLLQGTTRLGVIDYRSHSVTLDAGSPNFGTGSTTLAYTPATPSGATTHSTSKTITALNRGLSFVETFAPAPAPGTFTVSYMAQGRWYDLTDNGNGKLAGTDSSYGSGTINYATGSIAYTLGALPDVDSQIIYGWGNSATAVAVDANDLPGRVGAVFAVDPRHNPGSLLMSWSRSGTNYEATVSVNGIITGHATGQVQGGVARLEPNVMPDGAISLAYTRTSNVQSGYTGTGPSYTLSTTPVSAGSVSLSVGLVSISGYEIPATIQVRDDGAGTLRRVINGSITSTAVGSINYTNGQLGFNSSLLMDVVRYDVVSTPAVGGNLLHTVQVVETGKQVTINASSISGLTYNTAQTISDTATAAPTWQVSIPLLSGRLLQTNALAFTVNGTLYTAQGGTLQSGWQVGTGTASNVGSISAQGVVTFASQPTGTSSAITWHNAAQDVTSPTVGQGVFRVQSAPIKVGVMQLVSGTLVGNANDAGVISGGGFEGTVDFERGIVKWSRTSGLGSSVTWAQWQAKNPIPAASLIYNAVFLQYVPIDGTLLGLETARLPLDGKVPIYRAGGQVLIHNTLTTQLPNPLTKGTAYSLRPRIAAAVLRDATGQRLSGSLFDVDYDAGTLTVRTDANIVGMPQPFSVEHRIEDEILVLKADLSGLLTLVSGLTHDYPADTSYVSSKLRKGDLFARTALYIEQSTWTGVWADSLIGSAPAASYNNIDYPATVTNRGAITEQWAIVFLGTTTVRVIGRNVGQIIDSVSIATTIAPLNPQTGAPYFSLPAAGWGGGWSAGNLLRFNTYAAGAPAWVARTILPGPATVASDSATIAFRADVDTP